MSGTEGDDAVVSLTQGEWPDVVEVRWTQGQRIAVSITFAGCAGDDRFEASYTVLPSRWLALSREARRARLRTDLATWIGQAKLACGPMPTIGRVTSASLDAAISDFTDRLRYFAGDRPDGAGPATGEAAGSPPQ